MNGFPPSAPDSPAEIPLSRIFLTGSELLNLQSVAAEAITGGARRFTDSCQNLLRQSLCVPKALLTTSCTDALEMAALLLNIAEGDEVILPSFTFVSTANAFVLRGARPVFADIRQDTLNIDESRLAPLITSKTRAIVAVHYAGVACEMDEILRIAAQHNIPVVEDNAHGLFGRYRNRWLGSFGALSALSFHETKNFTCYEGGALLVNNPELDRRAEVIWNKGTNRTQFLAGEVNRYTWVDIGSSFVPSELCAAFLHAQLEARPMIQEARRRIWSGYMQSLSIWAHENHVALPHVPAHCDPAYHLFYLLLPDATTRHAFIGHLKKHRIQAAFHYQPLHISAMGIGFGGKAGDCPVAESASERLVRLPFYTALSESEQERVVSAVCAFRV
jgi:dTDP-4-amino-4,6-dideoxygalactose transaminase